MSLLYNPHLQSADDLVASFIDRQGLLRCITEELRGESPQHHLLVGQRGMGKTTLLQRIAAEIGRDPSLKDRWIALRFPEEQYNVGRLSELWLNCLDALADALEREGKMEEVAEIEEFVASLPLDEDRRSTLALDLLRAVAAGPRGLVLLIDNLQQLLGRLKDDHWTLRKVFGEEPQLVVIAASPAPIEQDYSEALYDFFAAHSLRRLDDVQLRAMLLGLAEREGKPEVTKAVEAHPARLRALRLLSGGNPRTAAQLYTVLARSPEADLRTQLEGLVDLVTPLYKARFEELAEQAQLTLDALARHWDPATAAALAEQTRLEVNTISTQLHRLHQEGWIDKVDIPGEARQGFQVAERFFNLWYLMRASRRLRGRLMTLAKCLEILYEPELLSALAQQLANGAADPDLAAALSMVVAEPHLRYGLQAGAVDHALEIGKLADLLAQLGPEGERIQSIAGRKERAREVTQIYAEHLGLPNRDEVTAFAILFFEADLGESLFDPDDPEKPSPGLVGFAQKMGNLLTELSPAALRAYYECVNRGDIVQLLGAEPGQADLDEAAYHCGHPELSLWDAVLRSLHGGDRLSGALTRRCLATGDADLMTLAVLQCEEPAPVEELWQRLDARQPETTLGLSLALLGAARPGQRTPWDLAQKIAQRAWSVGSREPMVHVVLRRRAADRREDRSTHEAVLLESDPYVYGVLLLQLSSQLPQASTDPRPVEFALQLFDRAAEGVDPISHMELLLPFLAGLIRSGHIAEAAARVAPLAERALPLKAAMEAIVGGDAELVRRYAPEVAEPARELLDVLWPAALRPPPPARGKKARRRS